MFDKVMFNWFDPVQRKTCTNSPLLIVNGDAWADTKLLSNVFAVSVWLVKSYVSVKLRWLFGLTCPSDCEKCNNVSAATLIEAGLVLELATWPGVRPNDC